MRIISNEKLIQRNARIGQYASIAGLIILVGGMVLTFTNPEQVMLSVGALIAGFAISQIGIYLGNRYAPQRRADTALDVALKGLDKRYSLYHYTAPVTHLLVGPAGLWVLMPRYQQGKITYEKGRWRQKGGLRLNYMRLFAQEGLGRPDLEIPSELARLNKFLEQELPELEIPSAQAALVFTHDSADVQAENAPVVTLPARKLKDFIRQQAKDKKNRLAPEKIEAIRTAIEGD